MRAVVALVETRPESIIEDYRRVSELAGLSGVMGDDPVTLVPMARSGGWLPGAGSPPWQIDGVLAWLDGRTGSSDHGAGGRNPVVLPTSPEGGPAPTGGWGWEDVLARRGAETASEHFRGPRSFRAEPALPALEAALPRGLTLPAGLRGRATILLPVPTLEADRPVSGAVDLLQALLAPGLRLPGGAAGLEVRAEVIRFARQALCGLGVVMDAVFWQLGPRSGVRPAVGRNILLAGRDPVAVDAVAVRLAGRNPTEDGWLRFCRDQEIGAVRASDIRLTGSTDLMDLDFGIPEGALGGGVLGRMGNSLAGILGKSLNRTSLLKRHARTPWGRLFEAYRAGEPVGDGE